MHASNKNYKEVAPEVLQVNEFEVAYARSANSTLAPQPVFYPKSAEQFARAIAMDEAEYEDMRAHGFYAEGTPFPQQPQTDAELQAEIEMIEQEEVYLDETEYRTAMNRLWSAFGCGGINGLGDAFKQKNVKLDSGTRSKVCQDYFCWEHVADVASLRQ